MDDRTDVIRWVASFLAAWEPSRVLHDDAAHVIVTNVQTALQAAAQGRQHPLPDALALVRGLETCER